MGIETLLAPAARLASIARTTWAKGGKKERYIEEKKNKRTDKNKK